MWCAVFLSPRYLCNIASCRLRALFDGPFVPCGSHWYQDFGRCSEVSCVSRMCFIVNLKHSVFSSSESCKPSSHEGSDPGLPCSAAEAAPRCSAAEAAPLFPATSSRCVWQRRTQQMKYFRSLRSFHTMELAEPLVFVGGAKATRSHHFTRRAFSSLVVKEVCARS